MSNAIANRAMLAGVNISVWEGRKQDKRLTTEVNEAHGAKDGTARVHKSLVSKAALAEIMRICGEARRMHYARTLPWADSGTRILSNEGFAVWSDKVAEFRQAFDAAVSSFVAGYADYVAQARIDLNGMFNASDYPSETDIGRRFSFDRNIWPMPQSDDFRVDLANGESDRIRIEIQAGFDKAMADVNRDIAERVATVAQAMVDKLGAYKPAEKKGDKSEGIFRDSLVENVRDLAALLPTLNVTGDARIADIADRLARLGKHDAADLRDSDNIRKGTAQAAQAILNDVNAFFA